MLHVLTIIPKMQISMFLEVSQGNAWKACKQYSPGSVHGNPGKKALFTIVGASQVKPMPINGYSLIVPQTAAYRLLNLKVSGHVE